MADFEQAFENTLGFEDASRSGKVTYDSGGRTRFGIAEKFHRELSEDFFSLPAEDAVQEAKRIEEREYWSVLNLGAIANQAVANKLFDMAVNMGVRQAAVLAQRAVNAVRGAAAGDSHGPEPLKEDGLIGPKSVAAINGVDAEQFLSVLRGMSAEFYRHVASQHPAESVDLKGWLRRAEA